MLLVIFLGYGRVLRWRRGVEVELPRMNRKEIYILYIKFFLFWPIKEIFNTWLKKKKKNHIYIYIERFTGVEKCCFAVEAQVCLGRLTEFTYRIVWWILKSLAILAPPILKNILQWWRENQKTWLLSWCTVVKKVKKKFIKSYFIYSVDSIGWYLL